jgi:hypothetical protein
MSSRGLFVNDPRQKMEVQESRPMHSYEPMCFVIATLVLDHIQCSKSGPFD